MEFEALSEGKKAVELFNAYSEFYALPTYAFAQLNLVHIFILLGQYKEALKNLELLLSEPGELTVARLILDPIYDPLRNHSKFQKFVEQNK
jgi:tetratricopeptide (TPR) repeat protein